MSKIYVASSWRNEYQQRVVNALRNVGHEVYDFKNPPDGKAGFHWSEIDPNWQDWTTQQYIKALRHEYAQFGFNRDFDAMKAADACVLVLPCGRSAHLEAGWMKGAGKRVYAYIPYNGFEPELMYGLLDGISDDVQEILAMLNESAKMVAPTDGMTFGQAIEAMKQGKKVARKGWNGKGMYLWLLPATEVKKEWCRDPRLIEAMGERETLPCLGSVRMFTATKEVLTGWLASQTDMLSEDWCIVE